MDRKIALLHLENGLLKEEYPLTKKDKQAILDAFKQATLDIEKLFKVVEYFEENMITEIKNCWEGETGLSKDEAETYLGHSVEGMTQEEIDDEVSEIQLAYYTEGGATVRELIEKFIELVVD